MQAVAAPAPLETLPRPRFRADIEGLRALAILLVVGYHAGVPGMSGGYIGVDVFFVLSGYLITWLLAHEVATTGRIDLSRFYARRARRLLPASAMMLTVVAIVAAVLYAPFEQEAFAKTAAATAVYFSNVHFAQEATNYLGAGAETNPLLHTWSLGVEEQFYFVWPLFVMVALGVWRSRRTGEVGILLWMVGAAMLSLALAVYYTEVQQPRAFFLSPHRAWEFAAGAIGLLLPSWDRTGSDATPSDAPTARGVRAMVSGVWGWGGLAAIGAAAWFYDDQTAFPGTAALLPVIGTVVVLRSGTAEAETPLARLLAWQPLQYLGRLSYSWYLWHWPVLVIGATVMDTTPLPVRLGLLILSLGIAEASYRFVETPIRHNAWLSARNRASLAMAVGLTACTLAFSVGWSGVASRWTQDPAQERYTAAAADVPSIYTTGCHVDFYTSEAPLERCAEGPHAGPTVVLFGDSHAAHWYPLLSELAAEQGWRLITATKSACPAVSGPKHNDILRRTYRECTAWRQDVFEKLQAIKPDLLLAISSTKQPFGPEAWEAGTEQTVRALSAASERVVLLRDTPAPEFDAPSCAARASWRPLGGVGSACTFPKETSERTAIHAIERQVATRYDNVESIDLSDYLCTGSSCTVEREGVMLYRDTHHLTSEFVRTVRAPFLDLMRKP